MSRRVSNEPEEMVTGGVVTTLALDRIKVNEEENLRRYDPKKIKGLAASIVKNGLLQNLIVSEIPEAELNGGGFTHQLRAAYRRQAALRLIEDLPFNERGRAPSLETVPVVVIPADMDPASVNMTENGQREEVDYISKANGAAKRIAEGVAAGRPKTEVLKDVAEDLGTTPGVVHVYLSMLALRPEIQKRAAAGEIPYRLLRVLPDLNEEQQDAALVDLENVSKGLSTVEQVADKAAKGKVKKNKKGQGRKKKQDSAEGPAAISSKKALLLMDEAAVEIDALAKADNVTAEQKAACKNAKSLLKVFAKVLAGSLGAQALGRQLIKRMEEE